MLFKPYLAKAILQGRKTQARRLAKPTHRVVLKANCIIAVYQNNRLLWRVGNTYAIQPGRGKKATGRFRLLSIRQEPLRQITPTDAILEGITPRPNCHGPIALFAELWNSINTKPSTRWQDNPQVFVLTFELVTNKENPMECPECGEQMDWLDNIVNKVTGHVEYHLYICHNSECVGENLIYNDRNGYPEGGDPSGHY